MVSLSNNKKGFSLIEVAIVMVIMGILAGGGISMMRTLTERKFRNETLDYMKEVKEALITYTDINGALPWADTDNDGTGDSGESEGFLPYLDLGVKPTDSYKHVLKYEINPNLVTDRATSCENLWTGLSGAPDVVDVDGSTSSFPVAAVIVSSSKSDADSNGDWFDDITSGTHKGNNSTGQPNYIRSFPLSDFDDLVLYIGDNELYGKFCESLVLAVNNTSGSTVYVWNQTQGIDLDSDGLESPESGVFRIISGTEIQLRTANLGGGSIVPSTPTTPIILSGTGCTIGCTIGFETSTLVVYNNSKKDVWVWNQTRGESLGKVKKNKQETYLISSETEIQLRTKDNGGGSIVSSTPTTPIILAGGDFQIDVS